MELGGKDGRKKNVSDGKNGGRGTRLDEEPTKGTARGYHEKN